MAVLLGLSLLLVQYVMNELPLILDIVPRDFSVKASKERLALLVEIPSSAIPRWFYKKKVPCCSAGFLFAQEAGHQRSRLTREEDIDGQHQPDLTPLREDRDTPRIRMFQV
jgi:hypothetical protein